MALNVDLQEDKYIIAGLVALLVMLVAMYLGGTAGQLLFSYATIAFITLYALFGCQSSADRQSTNVFAATMGGLFLILAAGFTLLWYFHFQNPGYADPAYFLGFPRATAVVMYLLWMPPALYLMFSYPYLFDRYLWDEEQVEYFKQLGKPGGGEDE